MCIRDRRGDLTANDTMLDIAQYLRSVDIPLNALYLSNAEQYFEYSPEFRRNMIAMPWGEKSVALRTLGWGMHGFVDEKEEYHYNVQGGVKFARWLKESYLNKAGRFLRHKDKTDTFGFSVIKRPPHTHPKRKPKIAPLPELRP